jgi:hypothetical protein
MRRMNRRLKLSQSFIIGNNSSYVSFTQYCIPEIFFRVIRTDSEDDEDERDLFDTTTTKQKKKTKKKEKKLHKKKAKLIQTNSHYMNIVGKNNSITQSR